MRTKKKLVMVLASMLLASCASQQSVHEEVKKLQTGPSATPHKSITNFASGLRCMDNMMIEYGVRDISMLVEDLSDQTGKVNAGTKDMLITAVSDMTRRSRAVKLIPFGNDSGNLISFLGAAGSQTAYNVIPQYDIRGSISQLDSSVVREQVGASLAASKWGLGASASVAGSILGIDLSVLNTKDLSVLPGVISSNAVVLFKSGVGADTDATIKKTGISFDFQVAKNDATVQALRNLIELASIELVGRLVKVPYWQCLDIPENTPEIEREIEDWFYAMRAHDELGPYVRTQLTARGHYPMSEADAVRAMRDGVKAFQQQQGLPVSGNVDYLTFKTLLTRTKSTAEPTTVAKAAKPAVKAPAASVAPLNLNLRTASGKARFAPGETLSIVASSSSSAYLYCFYADAEGEIQRFFPNRFASDNFLNVGATLKLPGNMPFDIYANEDGKSEQITCFASADNLYHDLPMELRTYDFEPLSVQSMDEVRQGFVTANKGSIAEASIAVETR